MKELLLNLLVGTVVMVAITGLFWLMKSYVDVVLYVLLAGMLVVSAYLAGWTVRDMWRYVRERKTNV